MIRRVLFSIVVVAAICTVVLVTISMTVVKNGFSSVDEDRVIESSHLVRSIVQRELLGLASTVGDWSRWDDAWEYVNQDGKDRSFVEQNIDLASLLQLRVFYVMFLGRDGHPISEFVVRDGDIYEVPNSELSLASIDGFQSASERCMRGEVVQGLSWIGDKMSLVAMSSISKSDGSCVGNGMLVFCRDASGMVSEINKTFESFSISGDCSSEIMNDLVINTSDSSVSGTFLVPSVEGGKNYLASLSVPSFSELQGNRIILVFVFASIGFVFVVSIALWKVVDRMVLSRLSVTMSAVKEIGRSADVTKKLPGGECSDEFGVFIHNLNDMLESIRVSEEKTKESENALKRSERVTLLGKFAEGIAHDLNNLLAIIKGYADSLKFAGSLSESLVLCDNISSTVGECTALIGKILSFSRRGNINFVPVDLHPLLGDICSMFHYAIEKKSVCFESVMGAENSVVHGNKSEIQNAILSLLVNAREAVSDNGHIFIKSRNVIDPDGLSSGEYVEVEVSDDGVGIPPSIMKNLFVPFQTTKEYGKGLGLSFVHGTAERHKGRVSVSSIPGKTSVLLLIPCSEKKASVPEKNSVMRHKTPCVVHVEDEAAIREIVKLQLEDDGFCVKSFAHGDGAISYVREHKQDVDFAILDFAVPPVDGVYIFHEMRKIIPTLPVAFMTGFCDARAEDLRAEGAVGVFEKPINFKSVLSLLNDILGKRG